jgi:hypothetical protein
MPDDLRARLLDRNMGHLVASHEAAVRENWAKYGYGDDQPAPVAALPKCSNCGHEDYMWLCRDCGEAVTP